MSLPSVISLPPGVPMLPLPIPSSGPPLATRVTCDYYPIKGENMGVPHGAKCTQAEGIAQERCTTHYNKGGARGWPKGNGPIKPHSEAPVEVRSEALPDTPRPPPTEPPPTPPPPPVEKKLPPLKAKEAKLPLPEKGDDEKPAVIPPPVKTGTSTRTAKVEGDDEPPKGAIILELKGYRDGPPEGEESTLDKEDEDTCTPEEAKRYDDQVGDLYRNPALNWLQKEVPPETLKDMSSKERAQTLNRAIHAHTTEGMMWKGLRYTIPSIAAGVGGMVGMDLENFGLGIDLAEEEFKALIMMFRIENEEFINKTLTTQSKMLLLLASTAATVNAANSARKHALLMAGGPPPPAGIGLQPGLQGETKRAEPVVGVTFDGIPIVGPTPNTAPKKSMGLREALAAPIPPVPGAEHYRPTG